MTLDAAIFSEKTLDDLMRTVTDKILTLGTLRTASKGDFWEIIGAQLEVDNPRARLSLTETRGRLFSCLGELCWYLSGSEDPTFIRYYVSTYPLEADGTIFGGYGPRLFQRDSTSQVRRVIDLLTRKRSSRRAVLQVFDRRDLETDHEEIPCTCTLQFLVRDDRLHMLTNMRSHDAYTGMPHDFFCFTMIQEIVARSLEAIS